MLKLLKRELKEHKRVLFGGDNYSAEWHEEAARRGLPILRDSVEAFPVLKAKSHVNDRARAADADPQFSARIREGLPRMSP